MISFDVPKYESYICLFSGHNNGNSGSCCNYNTNMPIAYLFEKTKLLEEEIEKLKSKNNNGEGTFNSVY